MGKIQEQNQNEKWVGLAGKQKVADRRARRPLGEIGNGEGQENDARPVNRPITRGYCAKLRAESKAVAEVPPLADDKVPNLPPKDKEIPVKPKSPDQPIHDITEMSPDILQPNHEEMELSTHESGKIVNKQIFSIKAAGPVKKSRSFTLTAKSRSLDYMSDSSACSMVLDKISLNVDPDVLAGVIDVDTVDNVNELAGVEYIKDVYTYYKESEKEYQVKDYRLKLGGISMKMRSTLVDWLIHVHYRFDLRMETLYLTINIVDRYLSFRPKTVVKVLQLVGLGALLLAAKYEEIWCPEVNDLVLIADRAYTHDQVLKMEKQILECLNWELTVPTPYVFLTRVIKVSASVTAALSLSPENAAKQALIEENMTCFLTEIAMVNYATNLYYPSLIAASALYAARSTLNVTPIWNETLNLQTGYSEDDLLDCAKTLLGHRVSDSVHFKTVTVKYSYPERGCVSGIPVSLS